MQITVGFNYEELVQIFKGVWHGIFRDFHNNYTTVNINITAWLIADINPD